MPGSNGHSNGNGRSHDDPLPSSLEVERALLGALLRDSRFLPDALLVVQPQHFRGWANQQVYAAMIALWQQGQPPDIPTTLDLLKARGHVGSEQADIPYGYLGKLWDDEPTVANVEVYARIIRDKATLAELVMVGRQIAEQAHDRSADASCCLEDAEKRIFAIAQAVHADATVPIGQIVQKVLDDFDLQRETGSTGLLTGWPALDDLTAGLQDSELIVIGARPSTGKTALAIAVARQVAVLGRKPVFFASLEQSRHEIAQRLLCSHASVEHQRFRRRSLTREELESVARARDDIFEAPLHLADTPGMSMLQIAAHARRLAMRCGIQLVIVDYLQLVEPDSRRDPRQEQVAGISRRLKHLARELALPVVALAQLNREPEGRSDSRPKLSDLRESGGIEADADTVLLLHRPDKDGDALHVLIEKQRNGPVGEIALFFDRARQRFESYH